MSEQLIYVGLFLIVFASIPLILKKVLRGTVNSQLISAKPTKVVSVVGLGQNQRVVAVEVGPEDMRLFLVLGVSAQNIVCLHKFVANSSKEVAGSDARAELAKQPGEIA